jgi:hypothetical protein
MTKNEREAVQDLAQIHTRYMLEYYRIPFDDDKVKIWYVAKYGDMNVDLGRGYWESMNMPQVFGQQVRYKRYFEKINKY